MRTLESLMQELPPELQAEVIDFAQFLLTTKVRRQDNSVARTPTFSWAGALRDLRNQYTSVELQHDLSNWRLE